MNIDFADRHIWVTVFWMPNEEHPNAGEVAVVRSFAPVAESSPDYDIRQSAVEVWSSMELAVSGLMDLGVWEGDRSWTDLFLGWPVGVLVSELPLHGADSEKSNSVLRRLKRGGRSSTSPRVLLHFHAKARSRGINETLLYDVTLDRAPADLLTALLHPCISAALGRHRISATSTLPPISGDSPDRDPAILHVQLYDVRGAQVGDHNVQVNRFIVRAQMPADYFRTVLNSREVVEVLGQLRADPSNAALRQRLEQRLGRNFSLSWSPMTMAVNAGQRGIAEFLAGMLVVQGAQIGDHNRQENSFAYVATPPVAGALLKANPNLAKAMGRYLCPPPGRGIETIGFKHELERTLGTAHLDWGRRQAGVLIESGPGAVFFTSTDGLSVGRQNRQVNTLELLTPVDPPSPPRAQTERTPGPSNQPNATPTWLSGRRAEGAAKPGDQEFDAVPRPESPSVSPHPNINGPGTGFGL